MQNKLARRLLNQIERNIYHIASSESNKFSQQHLLIIVVVVVVVAVSSNFQNEVRGEHSNWAPYRQKALVDYLKDR